MGLMTVDMDLRAHYTGGYKKGKAEGLAEGLAEGEARYGKLVEKLLSEGRLEDLERAATDAAYRRSLFEEFGL